MSESKGANVHIEAVRSSSIDIIKAVRFGEPVPPLQLLRGAVFVGMLLVLRSPDRYSSDEEYVPTWTKPVLLKQTTEQDNSNERD